MALVAHDTKKEDLLLLLRPHRRMLEAFSFLAPIDTALALEGLGLEIHAVAPGRSGLVAVRAAVLEGLVDAVVFLREPGGDSEPFERAVLRACDVGGVPVATNIGTAEIVLHALAENPGVFTVRPSGRAPGVVVECILRAVGSTNGSTEPAPDGR